MGVPRAPDVTLSPEDILYIGYTSGTTGPPKGALISHRAIVGGYLYKASVYGLTADDVTLNAGPFWHSAPRDFATARDLSRRDRDHPGQIRSGNISRTRRTIPCHELVRRAHHARASRLDSVARVVRYLQPALSHQRRSSIADLGEGTRADNVRIGTQRILRRNGNANRHDHLFKGSRDARSVGRFSDSRRRDSRAGRRRQRRRAWGRRRSLHSRAGLFSGYWRDAERTRAAHRGEWFTLGDMGRTDERGFLYLVDRKQT